jgi:hypothetical protein
MTRSNVVLALAAAALMQSLGCATILQGKEQELAIVPYPGESQITVTSDRGEVVYKGVAPKRVKLKRGSTYKVLAEKPGYEAETLVIDSTFKVKWMVLDVFLTGFIGIPIDIATGAANTLDDSGDDEVEVTLFQPGMKPKQIDD